MESHSPQCSFSGVFIVLFLYCLIPLSGYLRKEFNGAV